MLIEFRVENYRSLRDEQALSLEAGRGGEPADERLRDCAGHDEKLLPAAVIYGANASGKSNVLTAIGFMREAVVFSHSYWEPDGGIPRTPFAWGGKRSESSMFEASFLVDGAKYVYGFVVGDEFVEEEWLFAWPNKSKQVWFEREGDRFKFGDKLRGPNDIVKEVTRPNALFISTARQHNHTQLSPIYSWFGRTTGENVRGRGLATSPRRFAAERRFRSALAPLANCSEDEPDELLMTRMRQLLKAADIGVVNIKCFEESGRRRTLLQHIAGDDNSWLDLEEESAGTQALLQIAAPVFLVLESGGLLLVDELESSLHPLLGLAIIRLFNARQTNPKNAQIIFTTHDTNLLGTTLSEPPLRRDQIWFTEKDKEGASKLYPLTDYKPRKAENLERGYLQGRYGAIPFLGEIASMTE